MATEVKLPQLGMGMTTATIGRWLKREGDLVAADEPLLEIEAEKTNAEIAAPATGLLARILVAEGAEVPVYTVIGLIAAPDETLPAPASPDAAPSAEPAAGSPRTAVNASPLAQRIAREAGLDLATVVGTGREGRISERDVQVALAARNGGDEG